MSVVTNGRLAGLYAIALCIGWQASAVAQEAEPEADEAEGATPPSSTQEMPPPEPASAPAPDSVTLVHAADTGAVDIGAEEADRIPEITEAEPPSEAADDGPKLSVGVGLRTGLTTVFNDANGNVSATLDDGLGDQINIRPYFSGQLNEHIGFTANFEVGTPNGYGTFQILDAILQLRLVDELQVCIGQHIPAMDRSNINGPFYNNGWNFPLTVHTFPFDTAARDRGVTVWGLIGGGLFKYHISAVDLQGSPGRVAGLQGLANARYSARAVVHLLEPEDFYYNSGTYFGEKDVLALGVVGHYQNGAPGEMGEALDNDYKGYSFDAFFEKNLGSAGTLTLEGAFYKINAGAEYLSNQGTADIGLGVAGPLGGQSYMFAASWLTPNEVGIGKIQPNARFQAGDYGGGAKQMTFDVGVAYVIDGFNHRWHLNYRHQEFREPEGDLSLDMLQLGCQIQLWN